MKKVVAAFIAGALMMVSVQAFGDSVSKIGKKIQTEYTVTVDGKQLTVPAIAVDGTSYAPVRAIGEAAGYDVSVSGKSISLKKESAVTVTPTSETPQPTAPAVKDDVTAKIISLNSKIVTAAGSLRFTEIQFKDDPNNADLKAKYEKLKAEYADLLAQKAALEQEELNK